MKEGKIMFVLAIESSTSSAKAVLYDTEKGLVRSKQRAYGSAINEGGRTDPKGVFELSMEMAREAAAGQDVAVIALCGTWHSVCVCDESLEPVTQVYSWNFTGAAESCNQLRKQEELKRKLYRSTGCMPHAIYPRHTLRYLAAKGLNLTDKRFLTQGGYNFFRLTGEFLESRSTQSGTGVINLQSGEYDPFALDFAGVRADQFGELVTYRDVRPLTKKGAALLGLRAGIPVVPAHPDGALNQIGNYAQKPGVMTLSIGTSGALRVTTKKPILPENNALWCYFGAEDWITGAAISGACNCLNWFTDDFLRGAFTYEQLEDQRRRSANPPVFLPFLFGERCPGWNDERLGGFAQIEPGATIQDFYCGLQMGILFNLYQCYEVLCREVDVPGTVYVSGGVTNSRRWLQMLADLFEKEIMVTEYPNASLMGAVALAMHACGAISKLQDFAEGKSGAETVTPDPSAHPWYVEQYSRYLDVYNKV